MFRRWVAFAALGCGAAAACGERYGDPIAARTRVEPGVAGAPSGGAGGAGGQGDAPLAGQAGAPDEEGPTGLCAPCLGSAACGDANDACVRHQGETFCARDCEEGNGCPIGYTCVELENSRLEQCVPISGCATPADAPPPLADIREYLLARINAERLSRGRSELEGSSCLDTLAQESAVDYAESDEPLGKFVRDCDPIWPSCSCGWTAESEVAVAYYGLDWLTALELALGTNRDPPDTRFTDSFLEFDFTAVGIGFWISGDEAWIALSFR